MLCIQSRPDPTEALPNLVIEIQGELFELHREVLIQGSDYFRGLLSSGFKTVNDKMTLLGVDPLIFSNIVKTLYGKGFKINTFDRAMKYLEMVDFFQLTVVKFHELHKQLKVPVDKFSLYVETIDKIYPDGFDDETIEIIAKKIRFQPKADLSKLSPKFRQAIKDENKGSFVISVDYSVSEPKFEMKKTGPNTVTFKCIDLGIEPIISSKWVKEKDRTKIEIEVPKDKSFKRKKDASDKI